MREFGSYHPMVGFLYFLAVIGFSMFFMHPVTLFLSLASGFLFSVMTNGKKSLKANLLYILPFGIAIAVINPLISHQGVTILAYLPSGNPLTLESTAYGVGAGVMMISVLYHFSSFNKIMTSDKLMHLSGKVIPALSLVFSMVLRFVPRFKAKLYEVRNAQKCIGRDISQGNLRAKAKNGIKIISIMLVWCLENGINTADSMKSRGYGLPNRTAYSNFKLSLRDVFASIYIVALSVYIIFGGVTGNLYFAYFPQLASTALSPCGLSFFAAYAMLFFYPIFIEVCGVIRWKN